MKKSSSTPVKPAPATKQQAGGNPSYANRLMLRRTNNRKHATLLPYQLAGIPYEKGKEIGGTKSAACIARIGRRKIRRDRRSAARGAVVQPVHEQEQAA
jgi:hypothetical protein